MTKATELALLKHRLNWGGQNRFIGGAGLRRSGLPGFSTRCQGFRRHDGNRRHGLRPLAVRERAFVRELSGFMVLDGTLNYVAALQTFGSQGCLQSENDLVSVQEHDIGSAQHFTDHVPRLWFGGERWPGLQFPLSATCVGPLPVLTNPPNAFSSALN